MKITFNLNNKEKSFDVPANRVLLDLLRTQGNWSIQRGCETGNCGNCTIIVNGQAVQSCLMLAAQAEGKTIITFEAISQNATFDPVKECLMDFGDIECGYCISGMLLSVKALLDKISDPMEEEILDALAGHECKCTHQPKPTQTLLQIVKKLGKTRHA